MILTNEQFHALVDLINPNKIFNVEFGRTARGDKLTVHYFKEYSNSTKTDDATYYWSPLKREWVTELRGK